MNRPFTEYLLRIECHRHTYILFIHSVHTYAHLFELLEDLPGQTCWPGLKCSLENDRLLAFSDSLYRQEMESHDPTNERAV